MCERGAEGKERKGEKNSYNSRGESDFSVCVANEREDERKANSHPLEADDDDDENLSLTSRRVFLLRAKQ